jgi:hypothetical protein
MQQISAAWAAAIRTGYQIVTTASVLSGGATVLSGLRVSSGSVTLNRTAAQRRTFALTVKLDDLSLIPGDGNDPLAPFGNEIALSVGWIDTAHGATTPYIIPATGLVEQLPLGVFAFTTNAMTNTGTDLTMALRGYDRSWTVAQRGFTAPYTVTAGNSPEAEIQNILNLRYPGLPPLNMAPTGFALPSSTFAQGSNPWAACLSLADSAGNALFFDANGVPTGQPTPDPTAQPTVWSYRTDGAGNALHSSLTRTLTREGVANDFTVIGTGSQNAPGGSGQTTGPFASNAQDSSPLSRTWVGGNFGDVPKFTTSSLVLSPTAGQAAANTLLAQSLGLVETFDLTAGPASMFDIDDVIGLYDSRLRVNCNAVVDTAKLSLDHATKVALSMRRVYP